MTVEPIKYRGGWQLTLGGARGLTWSGKPKRALWDAVLGDLDKLLALVGQRPRVFQDPDGKGVWVLYSGLTSTVWQRFEEEPMELEMSPTCCSMMAQKPLKEAVGGLLLHLCQSEWEYGDHDGVWGSELAEYPSELSEMKYWVRWQTLYHEAKRDSGCSDDEAWKVADAAMRTRGQSDD